MILLTIAVIAIVLTVYFLQSQQKPSPLSSFAIERLDISGAVGNIQGLVYVASSSSEQAEGFMGVTGFGNCDGFATGQRQCLGMIFVFQSSQNLCFWMHDTLIALQQVWIAGNGTVTNTYQAQPESDNSVCHTGMYVLETEPSLPLAIGDEVNQSSFTRLSTS